MRNRKRHPYQGQRALKPFEAARALKLPLVELYNRIDEGLIAALDLSGKNNATNRRCLRIPVECISGNWKPLAQSPAPPSASPAPASPRKLLLSIEEVAAELLCDFCHVCNLITELQLAAINLASSPPPHRRCLRVPAASLDEFIRRRSTAQNQPFTNGTNSGNG